MFENGDEKKEDLKISSAGGGVTFNVKVVPASSRTALAGVQNGNIRVKVAAAPEKGKANQALIEFLSELLGVKKKFIRITSGLTSKVKQIVIEKASAKEIIEKFRSVL